MDIHARGVSSGRIDICDIVAHRRIRVGDQLTLDHNLSLYLCACGACDKSLCDGCGHKAVLSPCDRCRMAYYCSDACRKKAQAAHLPVCDARCANPR